MNTADYAEDSTLNADAPEPTVSGGCGCSGGSAGVLTGGATKKPTRHVPRTAASCHPLGTRKRGLDNRLYGVVKNIRGAKRWAKC